MPHNFKKGAKLIATTKAYSLLDTIWYVFAGNGTHHLYIDNIED